MTRSTFTLLLLMITTVTILSAVVLKGIAMGYEDFILWGWVGGCALDVLFGYLVFKLKDQVWP